MVSLSPQMGRRIWDWGGISAASKSGCKAAGSSIINRVIMFRFLGVVVLVVGFWVNATQAETPDYVSEWKQCSEAFLKLKFKSAYPSAFFEKAPSVSPKPLYRTRMKKGIFKLPHPIFSEKKSAHQTSFHLNDEFASTLIPVEISIYAANPDTLKGMIDSRLLSLYELRPLGDNIFEWASEQKPSTNKTAEIVILDSEAQLDHLDFQTANMIKESPLSQFSIIYPSETKPHYQSFIILSRIQYFYEQFLLKYPNLDSRVVELALSRHLFGSLKTFLTQDLKTFEDLAAGHIAQTEYQAGINHLQNLLRSEDFIEDDADSLGISQLIAIERKMFGSIP